MNIKPSIWVLFEKDLTASHNLDVPIGLSFCYFDLVDRCKIDGFGCHKSGVWEIRTKGVHFQRVIKKIRYEVEDE